MSKEDEPEPVNLTPMVPMTKKFKVEHESDQLFIRFGQPPPLNCGQALAVIMIQSIYIHIRSLF
jgi:hypothetical protein